MPKKLTKEEFIGKANKVHKNTYDYSLVDYQGSKQKVKIICSEHGVFEQIPNSHLLGFGCSKCSGKIKSTKEEFIGKANKVHKNKYDYSLVEYKNNTTKVKIICPIHGIFEQKPNGHLSGKGCPRCSGNIKSSTKEFIQKARIKHGKRYDYSLVDYKNAYIKVKIICPVHGIFEQKPNIHLNGSGCPKCFGIFKLTTKEFISRSKSIHKNKYDYSLVEYKNSHTKVKIICPVHGIFEQTPINHLSGSGCPKCFNNFSKGEKEVLEYIKSIYSGLILENNREQIKPYELDIFLPELNLAIEYNGEYWHKLHEERNPGYHLLKARLCEESDIMLINIWESEWKNNPDKIKENLLKHLK